jgi:hypothetical protein
MSPKQDAPNIQGSVDPALVPMACTPGVYLYDGTVTAPEDMNSAAPSTDINQPLASRVPLPGSAPPYYYQFTFLSPGNYTLAFTCEAAMDDPDQADSKVVLFSPIKTGIAVVAKQTTTADIP